MPDSHGSTIPMEARFPAWTMRPVDLAAIIPSRLGAMICAALRARALMLLANKCLAGRLRSRMRGSTGGRPAASQRAKKVEVLRCCIVSSPSGRMSRCFVGASPRVVQCANLFFRAAWDETVVRYSPPFVKSLNDLDLSPLRTLCMLDMLQHETFSSISSWKRLQIL